MIRSINYRRRFATILQKIAAASASIFFMQELLLLLNPCFSSNITCEIVWLNLPEVQEGGLVAYLSMPIILTIDVVGASPAATSH